MSNSGNIHAVILAAGYATRMRGLSTIIAKPALPVAGIPIVRRQLEALRSAGIDRVTVVVKHQAESVRRAIGDPSPLGLAIDYFDMDEQGIESWGSAYTVYRWFEQQGSLGRRQERLLILNGDIVWDKQIIKPFLNAWLKRSPAWGVIVARETPWEKLFDRFGTMQINDPVLIQAYGRYVYECHRAAGEAVALTRTRQRYVEIYRKRLHELHWRAFPISGFIERPSADDYVAHIGNLANVGIFGLKAKVFDHYARAFDCHFADFARDLFQKGLLPDRHPLKAFIAPPEFFWRDIGTPRDLREVNFEALAGQGNLDLPGEEVRPGVWLGAGVNISASTLENIRPPVVIGNNVSLAAGVEIGPQVVIGNGGRVEQGAKIRNSILFPEDREAGQGVVVGANVVLDNCLVAGGKIEAGSELSDQVVFAADNQILIRQPI
ncbi:MAG: NDP-sugar synthase [Candidatus Margulisiibacteriota bacterium]